VEKGDFGIFIDFARAGPVGWKVIWKLSGPDFKSSPPLTISTQIKFFKFMKYTLLNPQVRENVM